MQPVFWHWWILGLILAVVELLAPGAFFLWLGIAAGATGLVLLVLPGMGWEVQGAIFAVLAVAAVIAGRGVMRRQRPPRAISQLNRRGEQYLGRVFTVEQAIVNGRGSIRVDDTIWRAEGADAPAGSAVRVTGIDGTVLRVEPARQQPER